MGFLGHIQVRRNVPNKSSEWVVPDPEENTLKFSSYKPGSKAGRTRNLSTPDICLITLTIFNYYQTISFAPFYFETLWQNTWDIQL